MARLSEVGGKWSLVTAWLLLLAILLVVSGPAYAAPQYNFTCSSCHGMPPIDAPTRDINTGGFKGNHQTHQPVGALIQNCAICHNASGYSNSHMNGQIGFQANINNSPATGGGQYMVSGAQVLFKNRTTVPVLGTCSNVNCHFETVSPLWGAANFNSTAGCSACHAAPGSSAPHSVHDQYYSFASNGCVKCHPDYVTGLKFSHATSAGNRGIKVTLAEGAYSGSGNDYLPSQSASRVLGSCSSLYCHSPGTKSSAYDAPNKSATWSTTLDCAGCHKFTTGADAIVTPTAGYGHTKHVNSVISNNIACYKCHAATVNGGSAISDTAAHVNKKVTIKFSNSTSAVNGTYNGVNASATAYGKDPGTAFGACQNVYCHSTGATATAPFTTMSTARWGSPLAGNCTGCHGGDNNRPTNRQMATGKHGKHIAGSTGNYTYGCADCHNVTASGNTAISTKANHVNYKVDVDLSATYGGTYSASGHKPGAATGTCNTVYCHSDGKATGATYKTPNWSDGALSCTGCHGDAASNTLSGKHQAHVNNAGVIGANFGCVDCHALTVSDNTTISTPAKHVNKFRDYSGAKARGTANYATGVCSNLYCHSDGKGGYKSMASAGWFSAAALDCKGCHGSDSAPAFPSAAGEPNYVNQGAGLNKANSHQKHVGGATDCVKCHRKTTSTGTSIVVGATDHIDGNIDARFSKVSTFTTFSGAYNTATKTCSATYCHSSGTPKWGDNGSLNCASCHKASSTLPGKHSKHWESATLAASYTATPGNSGTTSQYQFQCSSCHGFSVSNHANGPLNNNQAAEIFFGFSSATRRGAYAPGVTVYADGSLNYTNGTCANIYCHSNGQGSAGNNTTFTWASTSPALGCADCHGDANSTGLAALSGRHDKHVNNAAYLGTNFGCVDCHARTVSNNTTLIDKTRHVNKFVDYSGIRAGKQANFNASTHLCSNIYCHSNGKAGTSVAAYATVPAFNSAPAPLSCKSCHGINTGGFTSQFGEPNYATGAAGSDTANSHQKHAVSTADCYNCHAKTTINGTAIMANSIDHLDGNIGARFSKPVNANYSGVYNRASKTCSSTYCHGTTATPTWGANGTLKCDSCHSNNGAGLQTAGFTGVHVKHVDVAGGKYNFACEQCHATRAAAPLTPARHAAGPVSTDQAANVVFSNNSTFWKTVQYGDDTTTNYRYRSMYTNPFGAVPAVSYTVGSPQTADKGFAWTNGTCSNIWCHSNAAPTGGTNSFKSPAWSGTVNCRGCHGGANTTGGSGLSATHGKHTKTSANGGFNYTCDKCHVNTVFTNSTSALNASTGTQYHVNAVKDVNFDSFNPSASYTSQTCSTTYCHSDGKGTYASPTWTNASSGACGTCHATTPATGGALISSNSHFAHFSSSHGPKLTQAAATGCQQCHSYTTENSATHVNKTIEAPLANCTANCHKQMGTIQWTGTVTCASCHTSPVSVISGVSAPDKGAFAASGHGKITAGLPGKVCSDCHDPNSKHISGVLGDMNRVYSGLGTGDTRQACDYCHTDAAKVTNAQFRNISTHFMTRNGPAIMACQYCHDPHGAGSNIHMIVGSVKFINSTSWTITYNNDTNGMINTSNNRGLCQVCHTQTKYFRAGVAETAHPTSGCFGCHPHNGKGGAFKPDGTCDACHGYPPMPRQTIQPVTFGLFNNWTSAKFEDYSGGGGAHAVAAHVPKSAKATDGWSGNCTVCHSGGAASHVMTLPFKSNIGNVSVKPAQNYKRFNNAQLINYSGAKLVNAPNNVTGSCYNISCHFRPSPKWSTEK